MRAYAPRVNTPPASDTPAGGQVLEIRPFRVSKAEIPFLNGLRGIAASVVMIFHLSLSGWSGPILTRIAVIGQTGVDLFFILSGFLITRILLTDRSQERYYTSFYMRRTLRIFPLYYFFLFLWFVAAPLWSGSEIAPLRKMMWSFLFLENLPITFPALETAGSTHYWSLAVEEHFYLVWPLLIRHFAIQNLWRILLGVIAFTPVLRAVMQMQDIGTFVFTFTRMDSLAMGCLLAIWFAKAGELPDLRNARRLLVSAFLVGGALVLANTLVSGKQLGWVQVVRTSITPLFYFTVVGWLVFSPKNSNPLLRILSSRPFGMLGKLSFGMYIYHPLLYHLFHPQTYGVFGGLLMAFGLTLAVSAVSYFVLERPFLKLKLRFQ